MNVMTTSGGGYTQTSYQRQTLPAQPAGSKTHWGEGGGPETLPACVLQDWNLAAL